jgi:hypothetical protein
MKYCIELSQYLPVPINNVDKAIQASLKEFHRLIIKTNYLETVKSAIENTIREISTNDKRCKKPITAHWSGPSERHIKTYELDSNGKTIPKKETDWTLFVSCSHGAYLHIKLFREETDL